MIGSRRRSLPWIDDRDITKPPIGRFSWCVSRNHLYRLGLDVDKDPLKFKDLIRTRYTVDMMKLEAGMREAPCWVRANMIKSGFIPQTPFHKLMKKRSSRDFYGHWF